MVIGKDGVFSKVKCNVPTRVETLNKRQLSAKKAWETMRKRGYKTKKEKSNKYNNIKKEEQRKVLIELLKEKIKVFKDTNPLRHSRVLPYIIYLESPKLYFTKLLQKEIRISEFNCVIPNHKEFDKFNCGSSIGVNVYGQMEIQYKPKGNRGWYHPIPNTYVVRRSFKEFISKEKDYYDHNEPYNTIFIWADYCGAFSSYLEDIELVFKKKVLGNNSIFAMTFNKRDVWKNRKAPSYSNTNCIVAVNDYVSNIAKKYGYAVKLNNKSGFYKGSMFSAIFEIKHNYTDTNQEKIEEMYSAYNNLISGLEDEFNKKKAIAKEKLIKLEQDILNERD